MHDAAAGAISTAPSPLCDDDIDACVSFPTTPLDGRKVEPNCSAFVAKNDVICRTLCMQTEAAFGRGFKPHLEHWMFPCSCNSVVRVKVLCPCTPSSFCCYALLWLLLVHLGHLLSGFCRLGKSVCGGKKRGAGKKDVFEASCL